MGQYWIPVNLDKHEYISPFKFGAGLKLVEQLGTCPGTGAALIVLCAAEREVRGGGDLDLEENWHGRERTFPEHNATPGPMPDDYPAVARAVIGRWAGDRIALVGDYAEIGDLAEKHQAHLIYDLCNTEKERRVQVKYLRSEGRSESRGNELEKATLYTDISDMVVKVIEHELNGRFEGEWWKEWVAADVQEAESI